MAESRLVYTSESGRICPRCENPVTACRCKKEKPAQGKPQQSRNDGIVRVWREVNGRGGKTVSVIGGLPQDDEKMKEIAGKLKKRCGTGGSVKDGQILIQGDHCDVLIAELTRFGFQVKRAGG